jgi:hypothetical protein
VILPSEPCEFFFCSNASSGLRAGLGSGGGRERRPGAAAAEPRYLPSRVMKMSLTVTAAILVGVLVVAVGPLLPSTRTPSSHKSFTWP